MSPGLRIKKLEQPPLHEAKRLFEYTELLPSGEGEIVRHTYYTLSFNSRHKQANWVYYTLELEGKERVAELQTGLGKIKSTRIREAFRLHQKWIRSRTFMPRCRYGSFC